MTKNAHRRVKLSEEKLALGISRLRPGDVLLEPDVAAVFKDAATVNKVLRALIHAMPVTVSKKRKTTGRSSVA